MDADISTLRKPGHFYFALTRIFHPGKPQRDKTKCPIKALLGN